MKGQHWTTLNVVLKRTGYQESTDLYKNNYDKANKLIFRHFNQMLWPSSGIKNLNTCMPVLLHVNYSGTSLNGLPELRKPL